MRRLLAALAALAFGLFGTQTTHASPPSGFERTLAELQGRIQESQKPREELEHVTLLAAVSMVRILEHEGRYQAFPTGPEAGLRDPNERWLYAGERVARVLPEEFPEYFELERCQRELGLWVGADEQELDRKLADWRVPRALVKGAERLAERARRTGLTATLDTGRGSRASS